MEVENVPFLFSTKIGFYSIFLHKCADYLDAEKVLSVEHI